MKKFLPIILMMLLSCSKSEELTEMNKTTEKNKIDIAEIKKLASKKIYFGHQSVGYNIIDGLKTIVPSDSGLNIVETSDPKDFTKPVFAHSQNGENCKPETKIADFVKKMDSGLGNKVDIAFFKLCYVDVTARTDVNKLFNEYKTEINRLIGKYPKTIFLHFTVPVTVEDESLKRIIINLIKKILGRQVTNHVLDNIKRMEYNTLLKNEYGIKIFDLASIESSDSSDKEILSVKGRFNHHMLQKKYTYDGGHLNKEGGEKVILKLFDFLNNK